MIIHHFHKTKIILFISQKIACPI